MSSFIPESALYPSTGRRRKPRRDELGPGENLCQYCTAKCCRYFALPVDTPESWNDFDTIRWFLLHKGAAVFTEEGVWYLLVFSKCQHLLDNGMCGIYATRPKICRDYKTHECEYDDSWVYDFYLETPEQVEEYAEALLGPRRGRNIRSPRPAKRATPAAGGNGGAGGEEILDFGFPILDLASRPDHRLAHRNERLTTSNEKRETRN